MTPKISDPKSREGALSVLDALPFSVAVVGSQGLIEEVNSAWRSRALLHAVEDRVCEGSDYLAVCDRAWQESGESEAAEIAVEIRRLLSGGSEPFSRQYACHSPERKGWFVATGSALEYGGRRHVVVAHLEVTDLMLAREALTRSEERWRTLFELLPVGVTVLDGDNSVVASNPALQQILRISQPELEAGTHRQREYFTAEGEPFPQDELPSTRAVREQKWIHGVEIGVACEDGVRIHTSVDAAPLRPPLSGAVIVVTDVTRQVKVRAELERTKEALERTNAELRRALAHQESLAQTDFLTGLASRRHFYELAEHALRVSLRYREPLSLVLFDVDYFKSVNDRFGHSIGDEMLRAIAAAAKRLLRAADLMARHGGEEFIVLLPRTDARQAAVVAEHILEAVRSVRLAARGVSDLRVTVSAGVAQGTAEDESVDDLIGRADRALYLAKRRGRDRVEIFRIDHQ